MTPCYKWILIEDWYIDYWNNLMVDCYTMEVFKNTLCAARKNAPRQTRSMTSRPLGPQFGRVQSSGDVPLSHFFFLNWDGSIPIDTLVGWTSIYQLFWDSLGTRVLTHPQITSRVFLGQWNNGTSPSPPSPYHNVQFFLAGVICPAKCHMVKATFWWVKSELSWVFSPK